jgi:hypothetical protein
MPDLNVSDAVFITEDISWAFHPEVDSYDEVAITESYLYAPEWLYLDAFTIVTVYQDIVTFGFTPKYIDVSDQISVLDEALPPDLSEVGISVDTINVSEYVNVVKDIGFNDLLRSYPFVTRTLTGIEHVEYENGVIQERDTWGRFKKVFEITFPPMTKEEASDVQIFFDEHVGTTFQFTNPVDSLTYNVRILGEEFIMERRFYNTYFARIVVAEVF